MDKFFYECEGVKISAFFDSELDGLVLGESNGKLKEWYIPKTIGGIPVKNIAGEAFDFLRGFDRVVVDTDNEYFSVVDGVMFDKEHTALLCYPPEKRGESYDVPEGVKEICDGSFGNKYLRKITLPAGLEDIVQYAFAGCENLEEITIPKSLKIVFMKAFIWCERLREVYFEGSEEDWRKIDFTMFNDYLENAHVNYNCKIIEFKGGSKS